MHYIGKSYATANDIVGFLNTEIKKSFGMESESFSFSKNTCCMVHVLSALKHLKLLENVRPFDSEVCNETEMAHLINMVSMHG